MRGLKQSARCVSVLSVEPWLVELCVCADQRGRFAVSVLSVEPWLVEPSARGVGLSSVIGFSALSRAVVGGTQLRHMIHARLPQFQCSQSSRGWWNTPVSPTPSPPPAVSVLSVEPWLVELDPFVAALMATARFSALSRAVVGGTQFDFSQSKGGFCTLLVFYRRWGLSGKSRSGDMGREGRCCERFFANRFLLNFAGDLRPICCGLRSL